MIERSIFSYQLSVCIDFYQAALNLSNFCQENLTGTEMFLQRMDT